MINTPCDDLFPALGDRVIMHHAPQRAASVRFVGAMEGVIPEVSAGGAHGDGDDEEEEEGGAQIAGGAGGRQKGDLRGVWAQGSTRLRVFFVGLDGKGRLPRSRACQATMG